MSATSSGSALVHPPETPKVGGRSSTTTSPAFELAVTIRSRSLRGFCVGYPRSSPPEAWPGTSFQGCRLCGVGRTKSTMH